MPQGLESRPESVRVVATLPTYNEAPNIETLIGKLRAMGVEVLVADDNSPDGTAAIVARLAETDPGVRLLLRKEKKGRGYAGAEAFAAALSMGATRIAETDADLSHRPDDLPLLLEALDRGAHVAIGSRFVGGGTDERSSGARRFLTRFSLAYARRVLGVPFHDCNSGYRAFTAYAMGIIDPGTLASAGPDIVHEVLLRAHRRGLRIVEVPIRFVDRERGESELSIGSLIGGFVSVWKLRRRAGRGRLWLDS